MVQGQNVGELSRQIHQSALVPHVQMVRILRSFNDLYLSLPQSLSGKFFLTMNFPLPIQKQLEMKFREQTKGN
jgi:hypothetical protein